MEKNTHVYSLYLIMFRYIRLETLSSGTFKYFTVVKTLRINQAIENREEGPENAGWIALRRTCATAEISGYGIRTVTDDKSITTAVCISQRPAL